ncbi:YmfQ family protein [Pseudomonas sp. GV071]|uniref:YmfQ family protein n=1 Tax=Pseudomonas sp. GV071 TaxID=2135754 RepID=UPI000D3A85CD|nr:YmfQ family protein [Pseudomonas sp. GV071]PTQ68133.1 uncharacterized protein YmfQ (DUF2313 family) [Pseudomonas sp. GV071]
MTSVADQLRLLLPPVAYDPNAPRLSAVIQAEANALSTAENRSDAVYQTLFPDTGEGLSDWERVLALPDPCLVGETQTIRQRVHAVVSKWQGNGGQSRAFFIALAEALGYQISITVFKPALAGLARAGDPVNGGDWNFAWRVNAPAVTITRAVAGLTGAGDPLAVWGNKSLECRLSQMKPAESIVIFGYGDD